MQALGQDVNIEQVSMLYLDNKNVFFEWTK